MRKEFICDVKFSVKILLVLDSARFNSKRDLTTGSLQGCNYFSDLYT